VQFAMGWPSGGAMTVRFDLIVDDMARSA
jgi:hypothetical protein